ncbi:MAG: dicarboxylate/amino acid:cation symporter [Anaerocolumna aminovalerica]|jgi:Na+/H+-dicarboxylate symporter|uniref:dicarboxylate/amino acid:cation symporter n=1 Tax=Anaerocolumna aminovalerica TaxID=1527 RepID=UPI00290CD5C5|nr:dicarboxylate/amino acid:cation symporter [Anaerocolumna aminovalerica]MDU6265123.1 dicarboxylate/amino acid:cation symporter [Anaerocolumna aminovalerica]
MSIDFLALGALGAAILLIGALVFLRKKNVDFGLRTIIALIFGLGLGIVFAGHTDYVQLIGTVYANIISAFVVPLLFFSVISSVSQLENIHKLKKIGVKSIGLLTSTTFIASTITIIISLALGVGKNTFITLPTDYKAKEVPGITQVITDLFPKNFFAQASTNTIVPVILFSLFIGIAVVVLSTKDSEGVRPFKDFVDSASKVINTAISFIIEFTPYAVLALVANAVSNNGADKLLPLLPVLIIAYLLCFIQTFGVNSILIGAVAKLNPIKFFKYIWPAQVVAFTTQSSVGTIPVTEKCLKNAGVSDGISSFVVPLGANIGMPGCAGIWPTLLAVFAIQGLNIEYSMGQYAILILITTLVSIGTVGVPGTSTITATAVFAAAGLPIEIIVLLTPISSIVDMARTATNISAAATSALIVAKSENEINLEKYNNL